MKIPRLPLHPTMEPKQKIRYHRSFAFHPAPPDVERVRAGSILNRVKRYPMDAPFELTDVATRAMIALYEGVRTGEWPGGHRSLAREFFAFRRQALRLAARLAPDSVDDGSSIRDVALWRIFELDPWDRIDVHLDALVILWLDERGAIGEQDDLGFGIKADERRRLLARLYATSALLYLDEALLARARGKPDSFVAAAMKAARAGEIAITLPHCGIADIRRQIAQQAAKKKHRESPKRKAKIAVYDLWQRWRAGEVRFKNNAQFALAAVSQHDVLESTQVVERWQRNWANGDDIPTEE
ncbi:MULTISPECIES: hypothetical protein [Paraburkholderia]|uniref:hypothetical protein n=1 Tax=Paraburkholderia TaxID=1822464 RepID=UPI0032181C57